VLAARRLQDVAPNDVSVAWQVPQYVLLTAGEVMFSVTGLEFSYSQVRPASCRSWSRGTGPGGRPGPGGPPVRVVTGGFLLQAPPSMKSVLQAGWLLTVAFGNVIVLIVAEGAGLEQVGRHETQEC